MRWPGNVRQLQNVVKRLGLTSREHEISLTEVEQSLENQPEMQGSFGNAGAEKMSNDIEEMENMLKDYHQFAKTQSKEITSEIKLSVK